MKIRPMDSQKSMRHACGVDVRETWRCRRDGTSDLGKARSRVLATSRMHEP